MKAVSPTGAVDLGALKQRLAEAAGDPSGSAADTLDAAFETTGLGSRLLGYASEAVCMLIPIRPEPCLHMCTHVYTSPCVFCILSQHVPMLAQNGAQDCALFRLYNVDK